MAELSYAEARNERRALKQKLFAIRRKVEGEMVEMTPELVALKAKYEKLPNFPGWSLFPERWDVGDPHGVKQSAYASNEVDTRNFARLLGKSYEDIISLEGTE
jgi:hypothetical protein